MIRKAIEATAGSPRRVLRIVTALASEDLARVSVIHLVAEARAADLAVLGRRGPEDETPRQIDGPPGSVVMGAGRPVLVVPPGIENLRGARIVVAWKDGPAPRRVVSAALPFIRNADQVHVVTTGADARLEGGKDVAAHLARHGAAVTTHFLRTVETDAAEILRFSRAQDADLLVTGAYGHSRLREWVVRRRHPRRPAGQPRLLPDVPLMPDVPLTGSVLAVALALMPLAAQAGPSPRRGETIALTHCARCHAVGRLGVSPLTEAPPFRELHRRYPVEDLAEALTEGIVTGHPTMPEFRLDPDEAQNLIAYPKTLER